MSDRVNAALEGFRAELTPLVEPRGPAAVRATVRRRRRVTAVACGVAAAVVIAVPAVVLAVPNRDNDPRPGVTPTTAPPTTSPPTATTPPPSPTTPAAPDGRISQADLLAARVALPAWSHKSCPSGRLRLVPPGNDIAVAELHAIRYADVDADGAQETLAVVRCPLEEHGEDQVVAYDRDTDGGIVLIGQVVRTGPAIGWIEEVEAGPDNTVRVEVHDYRDGGHWDGNWSQQQWRGYRWDGERFQQVDGARTFGPNPNVNDLKVTATELVFEAPDNVGRRAGAMSVTVRNNGPGLVRGPLIRWSFDGDPSLERIGDGWRTCSPPEGLSEANRDGISCLVGPLVAGEQRTIMFRFRTTADLPSTGRVTVRGTPDDPAYDLPVPPDPKGANNEATFRVVVAPG
jgi:hypothetical protein